MLDYPPFHAQIERGRLKRKPSSTVDNGFVQVRIVANGSSDVDPNDPPALGPQVPLKHAPTGAEDQHTMRMSKR